MRSAFLTLIFGILAGCGAVEALDPRFAPLLEIREVPEWPLEKTRMTTIFSIAYTRDMAALDAAYPPGSVYREAALRHEREHARRETPLWLARYATEPSFRLAEEEVAYRVELLYLRDHHAAFTPYDFALNLATGYDGMVSLDEAWAWVQGVLAEPPQQWGD